MEKKKIVERKEWLDTVKWKISNKEREVQEKVMECAVTAGAIGKEIFECDRAVDLSVALLIEIDKFQEATEQKYKAKEIKDGEFRSVASFLQCKKESVETMMSKLRQRLMEEEEKEEE